jgi:hypothetical protein
MTDALQWFYGDRTNNTTAQSAAEWAPVAPDSMADALLRVEAQMSNAAERARSTVGSAWRGWLWILLLVAIIAAFIL